jgi:hypothetical protein
VVHGAAATRRQRVRSRLAAWSLGDAGRRAVVASLSVLTLGTLGSLLAACGGDGGSNSTLPSTPAALAREQLLPPSSFPKGWKAQGPDSTNNSASFFSGSGVSDVQAMAGCLGVGTTHIDPTPAEAASREYDDPHSDMSVTDTVDVYPSTVDAATDASAAANPNAPRCIVQFAGPQITRSLPQGATAGKVTAVDAPVGPFGSHHAHVVISFPFTYQGVNATLYIEELLVQHGPSESVLQFVNIGSQVPATVVDGLARSAAGRLELR